MIIKVHFIRVTFIFYLLFVLLANSLHAQACSCGAVTTFVVNLSAKPDTTWSVQSTRNGLCCGAFLPSACIRFLVTVHPQATQVGFNVQNPAPPGGAFYQVDCGPQTSLGTPLCITSGITSFCITFCKSGGDNPTYTISTSKGLTASNDLSVRENCTGTMYVNGLLESTITWTSIFPGTQGQYNNYLSCLSICDTTYVTPQPGAPAYVDYLVCGKTVGCQSGVTVCDTVRVNIYPELLVNITPPNPFICPGFTSVTLTANPSGGLPPYSYLWSNGGTTQSIVVSSPGTYIVQVFDTSSSCPPVSDTVVVSTQPPIPTPVAGSNSPLCEGDTLFLSSSLVPGASYSWTGPNSFSSSQQNPSLPNVTLAAAGFYYVTAIVNGCSSNPDSVNVVVNTSPAAPVASSNSPICEGDTLFLFASTIPGAIYNWVGPNGFTANIQNPFIPNITIAGAGIYSVTATVNGCTSTGAGNTNVTVNATPPQPSIGSNSPLCEGSTLNLTASFVPGIYAWTGPNGFSSSQQNPSIPNVTLANAGTYSVTVSNGTCTSAPVSLIVVVDITPVVNAGTNQTVCANNANVSLAGTSSTGSGIWSSSGSGTFLPNNTSLSATYVPSQADINAGTVTITLTSTNNSTCNADSKSIVVTITPSPTANAGPNQTLCKNNANVQLNGSFTIALGAIWTSSGTGVFTPNNTTMNAVYVPSQADTANGSVTIILTTTGNGNCLAVSDTVQIVFTPAPIVNAGQNQIICKNNPNIPLNGTSSTGNGTWSTSGTGVFSPNPNILNPIYIPSNGDTTAGTVLLILTSSNNGNCLPVSDTAIITFISSPVVNAGTNQTVCANNANVSLTGTSSTGSGIWSSSGSGTFLPNNTSLSATYVPSQADINAGTVTITLTSTNNGTCNADSKSIVVTITPSPTANAGPNQTLCKNNANVQLNGSFTIALGAIWTSSGTGVFTPNNTTMNAVYVPSQADTANGSVTIILTTTGNGNCLPVSDTVQIVFTPVPVVNAGPDTVFVCLSNPNYQLSGTSSTGSGSWATMGTGSFTPNPNVLNPTYVPSNNDTSNGSVLLILTSVNNGGCLPVSDTILLIYTPKQIVNAGNDVILCANNAILNLNGSVINGSPTGIWSTTGSGTFLPNNTSLNGTYVPSSGDTAAGFVILILTSTNGCSAEKDSLLITFTPAPYVNAGPNQIVCANNANVSLFGIVSGGSTTGIWTTPNGTGIFIPNNTSLSTIYQCSPGDTLAGTVTIILTSTNNGNCLPVSDTMIITIISQPIAVAGSDQTVCANVSVQLAGLIIGGSGTGIWTTPNGTGSFVPNNTTLNGQYIFSNADTTAGTVTLILTSTNNGNCLAVSDTFVITITPAPYVDAGPDQYICANNSTVQLNGTVLIASGGVWNTSGDGSFTPGNNILNPQYIPGNNDLQNGNITLVLTSTGNGNCNPESDTMIIYITPAPIVNAGNDIYICKGDTTANLNGSITGGSNSGIWTTLGSGTFTPNNTTLNATYNLSPGDTAAGMVTLILTSTNNGNCNPESDTLVIYITTKPTVYAGNDTSICTNSFVQLNGIIIGGGGTGIWTTSGDGMFLPSNTTLNGTYFPGISDTAAGFVTLILTATNSCPTDPDSILITLIPGPYANAGNNITICAGEIIQLNGIAGNTPGITWSSSGSGTFVPDNISLITSYIPSQNDINNGTVTIILEASSNGLCDASYDTLIIQISNNPFAGFYNTPVCENQLTSFFDTSYTNIVSWEWTIDGNTINTQNTSYNFGASGTFTVKLIVENSSGCKDTVTKTLTVNPLPVPLFSFISDCSDSVYFTDLSSVPNGFLSSWAWDFGDSAYSNLQHPSHYYADTGSYIVYFTTTTDSGCSASFSDTVFILPKPLADFIPKGGEFKKDEVIQFTNLSLNAASWLWNFGDNSTSVNNDPQHTYLADGTYIVTLIAYGSVCNDTVKYTFIIVNDQLVLPPAVPSAFTPNGDGINDILYVKGGPYEYLDFRVFNEWGNEIFFTTDQAIGWDGTYKNKLQPNGTYIFTVIGKTIAGEDVNMAGEVNILK